LPEESYKSIMVLIPAYNAGSSLAEVVAQIREVSPGLDILVVDDGSIDGSGEQAEAAGARVLRHPLNRGKGAALRSGFEEFLKGDRKALITLDADGQHLPAEIAGLAGAWVRNGTDIVVGTRKMAGTGMPRLRILSNTLSSFFVSLSAGVRIRDSQSGYRLHSRRVVEAIRTVSSGYAMESEILIKAARRGYAIGEAPISTVYADERSFINPFKQPLLFIGLMLRSVLWRFQRAKHG
jgi:glycosyltransferase involved in cell wall biosynthesis